MSEPDPQSRLAGLTEEENTEYKTTRWVYVKKILESLAAARASDARKKRLLEKMEWAGKTTEKKVFNDVPHACCLECGWEKVGHKEKHAPDCALAAELEGGE